ncbi:MAG: hypothetical protein AAGJ37_00445 [Pseudomonadota bacterium]
MNKTDLVASIEATKKAFNYFFETNGGIAILIAFGKGNAENVTPDGIGEQFVTELNRRGKPAKYFYYDADWQGMTVEYVIGYSTLGPWGADKAAMNISKAVEMAEAAKKVHN